MPFGVAQTSVEHFQSSRGMGRMKEMRKYGKKEGKKEGRMEGRKEGGKHGRKLQ